MPKPRYIGVTGFMTAAELGEVVSVYPPDLRGNAPWLMAGVLMNQATLSNKVNTRPNRYPARELIGQIGTDHVNAQKIIHYSTGSDATADNLLSEMLAMVGMYWKGEYADNGSLFMDNLNGFQLNVRWPKVGIIEDFRKFTQGKDFTIILQIGTAAIAEADCDPISIALRIRAYREIVNYILLDPSGGKGEPMDVHFIQDCVRAIKNDDIYDFGIGIAGGLSAETLPMIERIITEFPDVSIDAEGQLRDKDDNLVVSNAQAYIKTALRMYAAAEGVSSS